MFDLERAVRNWKKDLARNPSLEDTYIAELEASLRDEVADRIRRGESPEEAFRQASAGMGEPKSIDAEFAKVRSPRRFGGTLFGNYVRVALRKMRRQKGYAFITISGLAVGLACCILMMLWVTDDMSFDRFHANRDSIFRVIKKTSNNGKTLLDARTPFPLGPAALAKVPEVKDYCRFQGYEGENLKRGGKTAVIGRNFGTADPSFFEIFSFPFIQGDPKTALADPRSIVLFESASRSIFGTEDPLGKVVTRTGGWGDYKITGVAKDIPGNSHIMIGSLVSILGDAPGHDVEANDWRPLFYYTYVRLQPGASPDSAAAKIAAVLNENVPKLKAEIILQPLKDVHLKSNFQWDLDNFAQGSRATLNIFTLAALGILFLAMINFMNLSTARSANRAKEVGLRKVSGAGRFEVMSQFLGESVVQAFLGLGLALMLVALALPLFNSLAGKAIAFARLFDPRLIIGIAFMTILTGLLSGSYPAFFLSAFRPAHVLKGGVVSGGRSQAGLRKALVVLQFSLTLFFVMGTAIVGRQLRFVRSTDLGMNTHGVISAARGAFIRDFEAFRNTVLANPDIVSVTQSDPPQKEQRGIPQVSWDGKGPGDESLFFPVTVDPDYLQTFGVGMVQGRFFSRKFPADTEESVVLNETAVRVMGIEPPLGKKLTIGRRAFTVIGVVKDFHQSSLHRPIEPMILRWPGDHYELSVRLGPRHPAEAVAFLEAAAKRFLRDPDLPVTLEFLDKRLDGFYATERKIEAVLGLFTGIALFTACLGLFGLASFLAEKRTKEIGIRRVLGARSAGLVWLQSREFAKWILVAGILAVPAAYLAGEQWLRAFAYHVHPGVGLFAGAVFATLAIALLAVGFQSVRAARANPIESLRYE